MSHTLCNLCTNGLNCCQGFTTQLNQVIFVLRCLLSRKLEKVLVFLTVYNKNIVLIWDNTRGSCTGSQSRTFISPAVPSDR